MTRKWRRLGAAFFALLTAAIALAGCTHQEGDVKAAHAQEDAAARQARQNKKIN